MISGETFKIYSFVFSITSLIMCVPFKWNPKTKRFLKSKVQFYLYLVNIITDVSFFLIIGVFIMQKVLSSPISSVTLMLAAYFLSLTAMVLVKLLVYHLEDEIVAFANKTFQLNEELGNKNCIYVYVMCYLFFLYS